VYLFPGISGSFGKPSGCEFPEINDTNERLADFK
jgi:hypothetical protein